MRTDGSSRRSAIDRFYELIEVLDDKLGGARRLSDCDGSSGWPERGVYFFYEAGEVREDGHTPRVVRVGTHALTPSKSTLWKRLSQHKGSVAGSLPGGGNHRGSVFRLHVGCALLSSGHWPESLESSWSHGSNASHETRVLEHPLEFAVSSYIRKMPFLWLDVDDAPSPGSDRGVIEAGSIALLSNFDRDPIDGPSPSWLGRRSARETIRASGLWNVNHVKSPWSSAFLSVLEERIHTMRDDSDSKLK
jgi:hypothetical protein